MISSLTIIFALSVLTQNSLAAIGPATDLVISDVVVAPDGFSRTAATAGGTIVGSLITGNKGDNFQINVINNLNDSDILQSTSIHWHGLFQAGTGWADGPAFVNQCPIAKGNSFLYDFTATGQAGTFWYHSHLSTQYCDGLRGALVIYDPDDPYLNDYDVDDDSTVITLSDFYHSYAKTLTFPTSDSTLINGQGRWSQDPVANLSVITVESGKRYRFRLVSISCDPNFTFRIQDHNMTVIEVDGVNHEQLVVDSIQIYVGQRYSFILTADQPVDNYWIQANPNLGTTGFTDGINSAILRYSGAADEEPDAVTVNSTNPLSESDLVPLSDPAAPGTAEVGGADEVLNLNLAFDISTLTFTINGVSYVPPTTPVLLQLLSGAQSASDLLPEGSVYYLPRNATVELSLPAGAAGGPHPFHLHGHVFSVVRPSGSDTYNYDNPVRRDVVALGTTGDNVTIRWTTNNPGPWFLHCHIDWHLEAGFAIVFAEDDGDWNSTITPTDAWDDLCPIYDALSSSDL